MTTRHTGQLGIVTYGVRRFEVQDGDTKDSIHDTYWAALARVRELRLAPAAHIGSFLALAHPVLAARVLTAVDAALGDPDGLPAETALALGALRQRLAAELAAGDE